MTSKVSLRSTLVPQSIFSVGKREVQGALGGIAWWYNSVFVRIGEMVLLWWLWFVSTGWDDNEVRYNHPFSLFPFFIPSCVMQMTFFHPFNSLLGGLGFRFSGLLSPLLAWRLGTQWISIPLLSTWLFFEQEIFRWGTDFSYMDTYSYPQVDTAMDSLSLLLICRPQPLTSNAVERSANYRRDVLARWLIQLKVEGPVLRWKYCQWCQTFSRRWLTDLFLSDQFSI